MRWFQGVLGFINVLVGIYSLIVYAFCYWPPSFHWITGFMMMSLPLLLLLHAGLFAAGIFSRAFRSAAWSALMLLLAFPFWSRTYSFPGRSAGLPEGSESFRVLSYNIHNLGTYTREEGSLLSAEGLEWLAGTNADLVCFQEVLHKSNPKYNLVEPMRKMGYRYYVFNGSAKNISPRTVTGLAVFSKFPISEVENEVFHYQNGIQKVNVKIGSHTLTLINLHLQSMTLKLEKLVGQKELGGIRKESRITFGRIKEGFRNRNQQVRTVEKWIDEARHPVIVCGDFNEVPYSYSYGKLIKKLANAHEEGGSGFGFTFSKLPYFIRIDHQFFDSRAYGVSRLQTGRGLSFSDHYPLIGDYYVR